MLENMLDYVRIALYIFFIAIVFFLYQAWEKDHPKPDLPAQANMLQTDRFVPTASPAAAEKSTAAVSQPTPLPSSSSLVGELVNVTTDTLQVKIDTQGGDIVETKLLKYPESWDSNAPISLLNDDPKTRYLAESGLLSKAGPDMAKGQAVYTAPHTAYFLSPNQNELIVKLNWGQQGLKVTKFFIFTRGSYEIKVGYEIDNQTQQPWEGNLYAQLVRTDTPPPSHSGLINLATYFGGAFSTPQSPFQKISFKEMQEKNLNQTVSEGWVAMIQHYFISAWVPPAAPSTFYSRVMPNGLYTLGLIGPTISVAPGAKAYTEAKLYSGPAITAQLEKAAPHLQLTVDYGWFWFISVAIFWMMQKIYSVVGNWGWSIVLVTIIIKLLFYPLSNKSYRSMSALKRLQPKIEALKERFGDDRQKLTQATLELYRQEKVNPMSGCLPVLIQIPVFIALYWVLVESVELRQAPWILWIRDLTQPDPYYVLPVLMGLSMFFQQRLNPPPADPMQAKVMMAMPVVFTVLFANFPAGLMLYWFVNNTLSFMQQWYVMHKMKKEHGEKKVK